MKKKNKMNDEWLNVTCGIWEYSHYLCEIYVCYQCSQMFSVLEDTHMVESLVSLPLLLWPSLKTTLRSIQTNYNKQCLPIISALENSWQQNQNFEASLSLGDSFTYIERSYLQLTRICEVSQWRKAYLKGPEFLGPLTLLALYTSDFMMLRSWGNRQST